MGALSTTLLLGSAVLSGAGKIVGARATAKAGRDNQRYANKVADDVIARGEEDVTRYGMDLSRVLGAQRTIIGAGQGLDVNQGSAAQLRDQTEKFGEMDKATIRLNAAREAWGIRTQAKINRREANAQALGGYLDGAGTLLGGAVNAWSRYKATRGPKLAPATYNSSYGPPAP